MKSKGRFVVFEGTDGSGKTTIINNLPEYLNGKYRKNDIVYYHWRPCFIKGPNNKSNIEIRNIVTNPHEKPPYGKIVSIGKFIYFNFDYVLGYFFKIRKEIKSGKLVVFDRYYYDYYLDKRRYRLSISDEMLDIFKWMIPKPDCTFLLVADAKLLYQRKKEISVEEIQKQLDRIKLCTPKFNNPIIIDVSEEIKNVIYNVINYL